MKVTSMQQKPRYPYANPQYLWDAIGQLYDRWLQERTDGTRTKENGPGANKWTSDTRFHRQELIAGIVEWWCDLTKEGKEFFPFHDDFVCRVWADYRRLTERAKQGSRMGRSLLS